MVVNPIDKVINRKALVDGVNKEIKRRKNISKNTKGKKRTRKTKNKGKKRKKKKVTTTQVAQPPIRLSNKDGDKLEVNIVAKERRKKRAPKSFAQKRAEEIEKTGIADPAILKNQQRVSSEILGYTTQTRDPLALRGRKGRYNVEGGVSGFSNVGNRYQDNFGRGRKGIRTGPQSQAVGRDAIIADIEELEFQAQQQARRNRQPQFRASRRTFGTQTKKGDDDSSDDDDPPPPPNVKTGRTPQPKSRILNPQPEPEPVPRTPTPVTKQTRTIGQSPIDIPAPIPRRTPPESYFAGRLAPDTPIRFRPINEPLPPPDNLDDTDDEITEFTEGRSPAIQERIQVIGSPELPQFPDAPSTPEGVAFDDEGFATPTQELNILPPEEPLPRPESRKRKSLPTQLLRPSSVEALEREKISFDEAPDIITSGRKSAFSGIRRPEPVSPVRGPEPEPQAIPPAIQSVSRGRGRPKGSKNKPRTDTPAVLESTKDVIESVDLKLTMNRLQRILKRRLGQFGMRDMDDIQSLGELDEAIAGFGDLDDETIGLLRDFWQIRLQLGKIKKL